MMKSTLFCLLFLLAASASLDLALLSTMASSSSSEMEFTQLRDVAQTMTVSGRKLKESLADRRSDAAGAGAGESVNVEDYHPIDPVPSSKAWIKHGPIEHGCPLNPFIPKPPPPALPALRLAKHL